VRIGGPAPGHRSSAPRATTIQVYVNTEASGMPALGQSVEIGVLHEIEAHPPQPCAGFTTP
jgi:hypothetical protein